MLRFLLLFVAFGGVGGNLFPIFLLETKVSLQSGPELLVLERVVVGYVFKLGQLALIPGLDQAGSHGEMMMVCGTSMEGTPNKREKK